MQLFEISFKTPQGAVKKVNVVGPNCETVLRALEDSKDEQFAEFDLANGVEPKLICDVDLVIEEPAEQPVKTKAAGKTPPKKKSGK